MQKSSLYVRTEFSGDEVVKVTIMERVTSPDGEFVRKFHDMTPKEYVCFLEQITGPAKWLVK